MSLPPLQPVSLAGRAIGPEAPPFVVAELSANHNGTLDHAIAIMRAAKAAGVDAIKLQTYTADTITIDHDGPGFRIEHGLWRGRKLYELYQEAHTPWNWHDALFAEGRALGLPVFSTPFDASAMAFLERFDPPAYKIASFELVDLGLIRAVARTGRPLILSTGMANFAEIEETVMAARGAGAKQIVLLHCTSGYPTPPDEANLRTIPHLAQKFGVPVGLSDHTLGIGVALAAVALGACLIEKHLTLRRADGGPDAAFSLEPDELKSLVDNARLAHAALGRITYERRASEAGNAAFRRSLYIVCDMKAGEALTPETLRSIRPGHGLPPRHYEELLGRRVTRDIKRGTPMAWDLIG
ncbi:MAG: pseudaminic acid synthase [Alphaproteobacteria bacterium]|nr:pseudaminic acid synthase [Alphaproteobacteria bacterium]